jgi:ADP-ribose pyrophosphatase YjhB (NUDIX family)
VDPAPEAIARAERAWGAPRELIVEQWLLPWEFDLIERVCGDHRFHDVTVFAHRGDALALVRKPSDHPGVWWAPAGGVAPGEDLGDAGLREVLEEAGVRCRVERYLLRLNTVFVCEGRRRPWTTHVLGATWESGEPAPIDTVEIEAARWVSSVEFARMVAPRMRDAGWGRYEYRLGMAVPVFDELGLPGGAELPPPLQFSDRRRDS